MSLLPDLKEGESTMPSSDLKKPSCLKFERIDNNINTSSSISDDDNNNIIIIIIL